MSRLPPPLRQYPRPGSIGLAELRQRLRPLWRAVRHGAGLLAAAASDAWHYARGSGLLRTRARGSAQAQVLKTAHRLDKGMALPEPRPGFGGPTSELLRDQLQGFEARHGSDWACEAARNTLLRHAGGERGQALERSAVQAAARSGFEALVRSRRSIRQFMAGELPPGSIERAVELARLSPSVCNRSASRVWWATEPALRARLLEHQNGHHGFGDQAAALLVISVRPDAFDTVGERNQGWIDGGLFAMTLIHALHEQGLGTCCLNWSVTPAVDRAFKRTAGLPPHEMVVMLLAVGLLPAHFTVAHSPRRPLSEVLQRLPARKPSP